MYNTRCDNAFGICQLGQWEDFNHNHINSLSKEIIDLSMPFHTWMPALGEIRNLFIISKFSTQDEITNALDLVRLCRNHIIFITVITPQENKFRTDLTDLKNAADIFLCLENEYYEEEKVTDPVSYAIDFMAHCFDEYIDDINFKPWAEGPFYAFSQSGGAKLIVSSLMKDDYDRNDMFQLPTEIVQQVIGTRLAFLYIKSGSDSRIWPKHLITNSLKKTSENMIYAGWCSVSGLNTGKKTWITAILSDMDNPNNSFGHGQSKTFFQGGKR